MPEPGVKCSNCGCKHLYGCKECDCMCPKVEGTCKCCGWVWR